VLSLRLDARRVEIHVGDNGFGVPEELKPHLFEPHRTPKGSLAKGLGLSLTRHLLRVQQGEVRYADKLAQGAVFIIELPLAPPMQTPPACLA